MTSNKSVKVITFQTESREVVPASHVFSGSGQTGDLPENLQHAIVIKIQEARVVFFELPLHRSIEQLDVAIGKRRERCGHGY